jgi:signal transduction histidine kinase
MHISKLTSKRKYLYIFVLIYLITGSVWLLLSEEVLSDYFNAPLTTGQWLGWAYVAATAILLYILVYNTILKMERVEQQTLELNYRQQAAESLSEVLCVLNSNRPLNEILDCIVLQTGKVLGADAAAIYRFNQHKNNLCIQSCQGLDADYSDLAAIPMGQAVTGQAAQERQPVTVSDLLSVLQMGKLPVDEQRKELLEKLSAHYQALMAVPLIIKSGALYGTLTLYYKHPRKFTDSDVDLAVFFSNQASLAIENARLQDHVERSAIIAERSRLARELHDSVTQSLHSVALYSDAALMALSNGKKGVVTEHLRELGSISREAMLDMRLLIFELHPSRLEQDGLVAAIQDRIEAVETRAGVKVDLKVDGEKRLDNNIEMEFYRIIQEALTNVVKHSKATNVDIHLLYTDQDFKLTIRDNGIGFNSAIADQQSGFGLSGIRDRVHQINGKLTINSAPEKGTIIIVELKTS